MRIVALITRSLLSAACVCAVSPSMAGKPEILQNIKRFFETADVQRRVEIAEAISTDEKYDWINVVDWLNQADLFERLEPGSQSIEVPLGKNEKRTVQLRIPADYDPRRAYPLIYALHGAGGTGAQIIAYVERILGERVDEFVVAAPSKYGQTVIHIIKPSAEHTAVLRAVRKKVHIDADRQYCLGYSRGGHTAWTLAVVHNDEFAAAVPIAGVFLIAWPEQFWPVFLPNIRHMRILNVWGALDSAGGDGRSSKTGGIAGTNRRMANLTKDLGLDVIHHELPDKGHGGNVPPRTELFALLSRRRTQHPAQVNSVFRFIHQANAYWIEGHVWRGSFWDDSKVTLHLREGEEPQDALARTIRGRLGELKGKIDGQMIDVRRRKVSELTIWIGDDMIDWSRPVLVKVSGRKVYEGVLTPDLYVCLSQAARTYDLQRLRWAGLRFRSGKKTRLLTRETTFPPLFEP